MKTYDFMRKDLTSVDTETPISEVIYIMEQSGLSSVPVLDEEGRLAGVISERDIIRAALPSYFDMLHSTAILPNINQLSESLKRHSSRPVSEFMVRDPVVARPTHEDLQVAEMFIRNRLKQIPVADDAGHLVGIVRRIDLLSQLSSGGILRNRR
ncbi:MAG: CBS domain-containing protein [Candidatus Bipolaricaulota bacterium]